MCGFRYSSALLITFLHLYLNFNDFDQTVMPVIDRFYFNRKGGGGLKGQNYNLNFTHTLYNRCFNRRNRGLGALMHGAFSVLEDIGAAHSIHLATRFIAQFSKVKINQCLPCEGELCGFPGSLALAAAFVWCISSVRF